MTPQPHTLPLPTRLAKRWFEQRTFAASAIPSNAELLDRKRAEGVRISVAIPALNEGDTIGDICRIIRRDLMEDMPLVDELVVLDGQSADRTAMNAEAAGARVADVSRFLPEIPVVKGKGESMWRGLTGLKGDIVVWVDGDIRNFGSHFVTRLMGPLLMDPSIDFVKAFYERPIEIDGVLHPNGGGRVTELLARPLLDRLFPELGGVLQPLAGEYAGRVDALRRVPFFSGYSVEVGLLIDLLDVVGLDGMAQADLGRRVHRNRPLEELAMMAYAISGTILGRAEERGRIKAAIDFPMHPLLAPGPYDRIEARRVDEIERPPIDLTAAYVAALRAQPMVGASAP
ncbi:MAG: glucosyl-3-phosphoglycerate synthase [Actinomycetota bacterium]